MLNIVGVVEERENLGSSPLVISDPTTKTMTHVLSKTDLRKLSIPKKKPFSRTLNGIPVEEEVEEAMKTVGFGSKTVSLLGERCEVRTKSGSGMLSLLVAGGFGSCGCKICGGGGGGRSDGDEEGSSDF
nr:hypothetical protein CFP56_29606 [Quercus suber]